MQFTDPHLPRQIFGWHSPRIGIEMPIVRYGTRGHALLLFPTAKADYLIVTEDGNKDGFFTRAAKSRATSAATAPSGSRRPCCWARSRLSC